MSQVEENQSVRTFKVLIKNQGRIQGQTREQRPPMEMGNIGGATENGEKKKL